MGDGDPLNGLDDLLGEVLATDLLGGGGGRTPRLLDVSKLSALEAAELLQDGLVAHSTGHSFGTPAPEKDYANLRKRIQTDPATRRHAPGFLKAARTLDQFWAFIKPEFPTYAERRAYLWDEFRPMLEHLESIQASPVDQDMESAALVLNAEHISEQWRKALERRETDPEGAITAARTLLESVCKVILDEHNVAYSDDDLPRLYKKVADALALSPDLYTEQAFKQILAGCYSVVNGLGTLRNKLSDSHGKGKAPVKPAPRHAELAVNLAGTMCAFLIHTHQARGQ